MHVTIHCVSDLTVGLPSPSYITHFLGSTEHAARTPSVHTHSVTWMVYGTGRLRRRVSGAWRGSAPKYLGKKRHQLFRRRSISPPPALILFTIIIVICQCNGASTVQKLFLSGRSPFVKQSSATLRAPAWLHSVCVGRFGQIR